MRKNCTSIQKYIRISCLIENKDLIPTNARHQNRICINGTILCTFAYILMRLHLSRSWCSTLTHTILTPAVEFLLPAKHFIFPWKQYKMHERRMSATNGQVGRQARTFVESINILTFHIFGHLFDCLFKGQIKMYNSRTYHPLKKFKCQPDLRFNLS